MTDRSAGWERLSDEELIAEYCQAPGPRRLQELFDEIFRRYHARVVYWCFRYLRDRETAFDLAQDVFLKAFKRFHTFRSDAKLSTWLFTVTRNHCIDAINKRSSEPDMSDVTTVQLVDSKASNIENDLQRWQRANGLLKMVREKLSPTEIRIMTLHYGHDMPLAAVTGLLGLKNRSGAKAYIVSARRKLDPAVRGLRELQVAS